MSIKIIIISKLEETRLKVAAALESEDIYIAGQFKDGASALSRIESVDPDIVIMMLDTDESDVFATSERIYMNRPSSVVMLITKNMDVDVLQRAMKAGIRHVIPWKRESQYLIENVRTVYNEESSHRDALKGEQSLGHTSKVITVFGSKGGSGKTTIAVNLAVNLAKKKKKVALIDLDLQYGDANIFLNLETNDTLDELIQGYADFDIDTIRNYMKTHSSGVHILIAPKSPEYAEFITREHVEKLINIIRPYYDYLIIDVSASFDDITILAIDSSNLILMVTGLDVSILRNSKISLKVLESIKQISKVKLVINRDSKGSISVSDVEKILQCPIAAVIPSDWKTVGTALNTGIPFVQNVKRTRAGAAIDALTKEVIEFRPVIEKKEEE
ncbi:MAG: AAA family ATPase [Clostridia bacterium]|jgi:pilus assembly protein CpaE|nr:AAA family ATPase [Clostridia bacterium]